MANSTAINSETMIYRVWRYVPKWTLWETKSDNGMRYYSLEYQDEKKGTARSVQFISKAITARLRYMRDYRPELLMEQLNNGTLYINLLRLDRKVTNAIDKQVMKWQETDKEYLAAEGDFLEQYCISQRMRMEAENLIYDAMVYV